MHKLLGVVFLFLLISSSICDNYNDYEWDGSCYLINGFEFYCVNTIVYSCDNEFVNLHLITIISLLITIIIEFSYFK